MPVLVAHHPVCGEHDAGPGHPERPGRLDAVLDGIAAAGLGDGVTSFEPRPATPAELALVHDPRLVEALRGFCEKGGGWVSGDTHAGPRSWDAALAAAGAPLDAVGRIERGEGEHAFCAVRPPGHHADAGHPQGFCLFNNVAVCAAALAERGERVLIVDWDVHHGNGTQDIFFADPRVLYVSMHQWPLYPGTGRLEETGEGDGRGFTINFPFPPDTTGEAYLAAFDAVVDPAAAAFDPTWVLVSAGFDAHRAESLEDSLGQPAAIRLTSGDFANLTTRCAALAPPGRCVLVLEGGYDPDALAMSAGACVAALAGIPFGHGAGIPFGHGAGVDHRPEPPTTGGPGLEVVESAARLRSTT